MNGETENKLSPIVRETARRLKVSPAALRQEDLETYQLGMIRKLITRLKERGGFYSSALKNIFPEEIRTMKDFRKLPLTCEQDLAEHETLFQCVRPGDVERIITVPTTGTHGRSKHIAFTLADIKKALDFSLTAFTTFAKENDRVLVFMSGSTAGGVGDSIRRSLEPLKVTTHIYGPVGSIPEAYAFLKDFHPDIVVGIPCQMAALASYGRSIGDVFSVRNVLLSSDDVPDAICDRLRRIWHCEPYRHFGMTETCLMGGCECAFHCGYHMRSYDHLFEIIDPDENGFGELAVTTFSHEAMPLLRYKTGDIARISTEPCRCGGKVLRIGDVRGRRSNSFLSGGRRIFLRDIEECLFSFDGIIDFDCKKCGPVIKCRLRHLPGSVCDLNAIEKELNKMTEDDISFELSSSEALDFHYGYNAKKTL